MAATNESNRLTITVAWIATLIASSLAIIIWREIAGSEPFWLGWIHFAALLAISVSTFFIIRLKTIRGFVLILLAIYTMGFGGGWTFGVIPLIRSSLIWTVWESQVPWAVSAIATHLLRLTPAILILTFLLVTGYKRKDFFLIKGQINAPIEPTMLLGIKKPEPWTKTAIIFAVVFASTTLAYLIFSSNLSSATILAALPLFPVAALIAIINAFNEEFTLRAAPLSKLWKSLGKQQALMITTVFFGLGHFYGVPSGILGVALSGFLGWFLGKTILETKGFFWAWLIHFLPDVFIFSFFAMTIAA